MWRGRGTAPEISIGNTLDAEVGVGRSAGKGSTEYGQGLRAEEVGGAASVVEEGAEVGDESVSSGDVEWWSDGQDSDGEVDGRSEGGGVFPKVTWGGAGLRRGGGSGGAVDAGATAKASTPAVAPNEPAAAAACCACGCVQTLKVRECGMHVAPRSFHSNPKR